MHISRYSSKHFTYTNAFTSYHNSDVVLSLYPIFRGGNGGTEKSVLLSQLANVVSL